VLLLAHRAIRQRGRLPRDGIELFEQLGTAEGLEAFLRLTRDSQFEACAVGINPLTARFYADLSDASTEAGGIRIASADPVREPAAAVVVTTDCSGDLYSYQLLDDSGERAVLQDLFCIEPVDPAGP
jgi:hypothetical protein